MDIVNQVLQKAARAAEQLKPITVDKHLDVEFDVGNLLAFDTNEIELERLRSDCDNYLKDLTRDNSQLLLNKVWELPTNRVEEAIVAELPKPKYIIPRSLPVPKPKEPTRWEKFAAQKGIVKNKKAKLTWDDILQKWIPRYGFKKVTAENEKNWLIEVPGNADPMEDQFEKKRKAKKENIAKNELQRLRNIAAAKKIKVPEAGMLPKSKIDSKEISRTVSVAKFSTASGGKFQAGIPKEKPASNLKKITPVAPYKKLNTKPTIMTRADEKKFNLDLVEKILNKKPKLDFEAAVNKELFQQNTERAEEKKNEKPKGTPRGGRRAKGGKLKASKGNKGKKGKAGRKRR